MKNILVIMKIGGFGRAKFHWYFAKWGIKLLKMSSIPPEIEVILISGTVKYHVLHLLIQGEHMGHQHNILYAVDGILQDLLSDQKYPPPLILNDLQMSYGIIHIKF